MGAELGLVAGAGALPRLVLAACRASSRAVFVLAIEGHADPGLVVGVPHAWVRLGAAAGAVGRLRAEGVRSVVLAGAVRRPSLAELRPDFATLRFLTGAARHARGDDALLKAVVRAIEAEGFAVMAPEVLVGDLVMPAGPLGRLAVPHAAWDDIRRGAAVLRAMGHADVGQAVVVQQGIVLAVEAAEGTDAMIARAGTLARGGLGGVLVKLGKPGQERRADRPTIGPETVAAAAAAGLRGIAAEADEALVVDRAAVAAAADLAGLFVVGIRADPLFSDMAG
ncbi:MAG: LpxI family protein [Alphaproteobacteria bacterium]